MTFAFHTCAVIGCLLATATGCGRDHPESNLLGWTDSPVPVKLVLHTGKEPNLGKLIDPEHEPWLERVERYEIVAESSPSIRIPLPCTPAAVQVTLAKSLDRMGFRCDATEPWQAVWIRPDHSVMSFSRIPLSELGSKAPPLSTDGRGLLDANQLPPFLDAAQEWLPHRPGKFSKVLGELSRQGDQNAVVTLMSNTVALPPSSSFDSTREKVPDTWLDKWTELSPDQKNTVNAALKQVITRPHASSGALLRALRIFDAADATLAHVWADRAWELTRHTPIDARGWGDWIFGAILHRLGRLAPEESGKIGCAAFSQPYVVYTGALMAIAAADTPCPAVAERLKTLESQKPCGLHLSCGGFGPAGHVCTDEEVAAEVDRFFGEPMSIKYYGVKEDRALAIAGKQTNSIPPGLLKRAERTHYAVEMPEKPLCYQVEQRGQACQCGSMKLCELPIDATSGSTHDCTFQIDDENKRVVNVRHLCRKPTMICRSDQDCCEGLSCPAGDGGVSFCVETK